MKISNPETTMFDSKIETDPETGKQSLTVYYDPVKDDFNDQIELAMVFYGVSDGDMVIIAMPENWQNNGDSSHIHKGK